MSINFKLDDRRDDVDPADDPWGRTWIGWAENLSEEDVYEQNRGVWLLGKRSRNERLATFSHQGRVKVVVAIGDFEYVPGGKQAIIGRVLSAGDPDYDALIGTAVDAFRNPVTYQEQGDRVCACGCGASVAGTITFLPVHDQRPCTTGSASSGGSRWRSCAGSTKPTAVRSPELTRTLSRPADCLYVSHGRQSEDGEGSERLRDRH